MHPTGMHSLLLFNYPILEDIHPFRGATDAPAEDQSGSPCQLTLSLCPVNSSHSHLSATPAEL